MIHSVRAFHILVFSRCVVALLFSTACVSTPQYEQVSSAAEVERESHRRTHVALEAAEKRLAILEGRLSTSEGSLSQEAGARAELDLKQTKTERELLSARELVEELRHEIQRLRDNLDLSSDEVTRLKSERDKFEQELASSEKCPADAAPTAEPPAPPSAEETLGSDRHAADQGEVKGAGDDEMAPPPLSDRGA